MNVHGGCEAIVTESLRIGFCGKMKDMVMWQKFVRAATLILLLIAVSDVLVVDTAFAATCSSNTTTSSTTQNPNYGPGDEDCYCCCTHIVLATSPKLVCSELVEALYFERVPSSPITEPKPILHPPRV